MHSYVLTLSIQGAMSTMSFKMPSPSRRTFLKSTGVTVASYEGANHGFVHDPSRPAHRPLDAKDAWKKAKNWIPKI